MDSLGAFAAGYGFDLDEFQRAGIAALIDGRSTLVAAPTGAGKTVVGEFAVWQALRSGGKCFYTTPIKALSNQKYTDLVRRHGAAQVGLLTGDNAVNGDAPVVVMTTEVLRNMLYEGSRALVGLQAVVLDEVHYLADRERGAVWEEVIIQLSEAVQLACLSATVSNAEDFGAWLRQVRDSCDVVISERRPVPLEHHYALNDRLYPVFRERASKDGADAVKARSAATKQALRGTPNPEVVMLERRSAQSHRVSRRGRRQHTGARLRPPRRSDLVTELGRRRWLPAIYFLFSRQGCDAAVTQLLGDGVVLTQSRERAAIRAIAEERTADLGGDDLDALGFAAWLDGLERGVAAHHAGMVPAFKHTVEDLFVRGLVKVCFATETLALGINMPARTVVIERLEKWDGQQHSLLTPGQFTQLTGRAGRRGMDTVGHAVVAYQRDVDFLTVASLVGRRTEPLRSSFTPSYNMAVNLLRRHDRAEAESLLARSFAQYQADAGAGGDRDRLARNREALEGYAANLASEHGDFDEYWALRRELSRLESAAARDRRRRRADAVEAGLARLREGDVVALDGGRRDLAAVVGVGVSRAGMPLVSVVTDERKLVRVGTRELSRPPLTVGRVALPDSGGPRQAAYRKQVAQSLRELDVPGPARARDAGDGADGAEGHTRARIDHLRGAVRAHPVHADPALGDLEVWARRYDDLLADTERLERHTRRRTGSLVRIFDRIVRLLTDLGYLTDDPDAPRPTAEGLRLAGLYAETDLVLAEALRRGLLDDLEAAELAALASVFVYETRLKEPPEPWLPTERVRERVDGVEAIWSELAAREEAAGLPVSRAPDAGFAEAVWRWARGADLDTALGEADMTPGDFVRSVKQVADLLRQMRDVRGDPALSDTAHRASATLVRGVVAHTGLA